MTLDWRIQQFLSFWRIHIFGRYHDNPRIDTFFDRLAEKGVHDRFYTKLADRKRVLHHNALHLLILHSINKLRTRVKPYKRYLSRFVNVLQSEQHSGRCGLIRRENAGHLIAETLE